MENYLIKINNNYYSLIKNGKGYIKEYNNENRLEFEGEYSNGNINGRGKAYYRNGQLNFDGKYLNGLRKKGKEYNINGQLKYEGGYTGGIRNDKVGLRHLKRFYIFD